MKPEAKKLINYKLSLCLVLLLTLTPLHSHAVSNDNAVVAQLQQQLDDAHRETSYWKWALGGVTALYIFIYIMGRRRLMRKIWKRNRQLRSALNRADEANRIKAAFIRSVNHEVRTPLNAINGFSQLLCSPDFELGEEEKTDMKNRIQKNVDTITLVINELLEMAEGESKTVECFDEVAPDEVCRNVVSEAQQLNTKGLELTFKNGLKEGFTIKSNRDIIVQILQKLLDNAMKFTESGAVSVHCGRSKKYVEISVTDTGIGIPKDKRNAIFRNFVKLDDYKGGVGLGLPICRRLARTLGGDIRLDDKYEKGSRFVLQLPV